MRRRGLPSSERLPTVVGTRPLLCSTSIRPGHLLPRRRDQPRPRSSVGRAVFFLSYRGLGGGDPDHSPSYRTTSKLRKWKKSFLDLSRRLTSETLQLLETILRSLLCLALHTLQIASATTYYRPTYSSCSSIAASRAMRINLPIVFRGSPHFSYQV
jgi:hypothetical protein